ncbi:MAG: GspH/FimT family pseudopilin [Deltaproteobacteria bacterium]|nr:GspH/FimT family pseudopilin [Deltaproteobacteria bacterium]
MERGFSIIELLVTISIMLVLMAVTFPHLGSFSSQMQASDDVRKLAYALSELRAEAIRLKTNVRIMFDDEGYSWDIDDNDNLSPDGSIALHKNSSWGGQALPSDIVFNGLGIARGIGTETEISIKNSDTEVALTLNTNGFIGI